MRITTLIMLAVAGSLSACGSDEPAAPAAAAATAAKTSGGSAADPRIAATAAQVAEEARGKVRCPAKPATSRDASMPVADVVGVWPGLTYDEAVNVVLCTNDLLVVTPSNRNGFRIETYGQTLRHGFGAAFAEDRVNRTSREIIAEMQNNAMARSSNKAAAGMPGGTARWYVTTMGLPGEERVLAAARIEAYEPGQAPTVAAVGEALAGKYGAPTAVNQQAARTTYQWAYDPFNRRITETSPLYGRCSGLSHPDEGMNLSPDCGLVIEAVIVSARDNPLLAATLQVGVVDQAQGYESLMATERQLEQMEQQRRAEQVEAAGQAAAPTL